MRVVKQRYEDVPVAKLQWHPKNARRGDVGAICESIDANGFYGAVIAQVSTGYIIAGNHRYKAALSSDASTVPTIWVDCDDDTALRILLVDNATNDKATNDNNQLVAILQELADADPVGGLVGTGYDGDDLDAILQDLAKGIDADELAELSEDVASNTKQTPMLKWPGGEVPVTDEEAIMLCDALDAHQEREGVVYGFVRAMLHK